MRFESDDDFTYEVLEPLSPLVRRIVAQNPGGFTGTGTATYVVGHGRVAVIDPGPSLNSHVQGLLNGLRGETVERILVTHSHIDHWPAAEALQRATGAAIYGYGGPSHNGPSGGREETRDYGFVPDQALQDGDVLDGGGWRIKAVHTPGHASDHLCYSLEAERVLFSGDHVMGWSTSVIIPPDGNMADYMRSLHVLLEREDAIYFPGHGPAVRDPRQHVRAFIEHRRERTAAILRELRDGARGIPELVRAVYTGLSPGLQWAAGQSVLAHLIELRERGDVICDGAPSSGAQFRLSGKK